MAEHAGGLEVEALFFGERCAHAGEEVGIEDGAKEGDQGAITDDALDDLRGIEAPVTSRLDDERDGGIEDVVVDECRGKGRHGEWHDECPLPESAAGEVETGDEPCRRHGGKGAHDGDARDDDECVENVAGEDSGCEVAPTPRSDERVRGRRR